jgi:hypothetical protein
MLNFNLMVPSQNTPISVPQKWKLAISCVEKENFLLQHRKPSQDAHVTTRKKPIRGVQNLVIGGVSLYATGKKPLVQAYPWHTDCTPRLWHLPVAYRPVHHGCVLYPWRTGLYASGVYRSSGVRLCTPLMCTPLNFHFGTPRLCFFDFFYSDFTGILQMRYNSIYYRHITVYYRHITVYIQNNI